jgi:threonine dehydrogenase-like Zn-dependent dehydrogenase
MVGARVAALEIDPVRRRVAEQASLTPVLDPHDAATPDRLNEFFRAPGPDVVVETSQSWSGLLAAARLARENTRIAILGIYRTEPSDEVAREVLRHTFMDRDQFHNQHVRFIGCSNDPADEHPPGAVRWTIQRNMQYIADQIAAGRLDPTPAITHRVRWDELGQVYEQLAAGDRGMVGVTLHWD